MTQKQEKATDTRATEKPNRILTAVEAMRGEVAALRSELQQIKDSQYGNLQDQPVIKGEDPSQECHHLRGHLVNHVKLMARKKAVITAASVVVGNTVNMDVNTSFRKFPEAIVTGWPLVSEVKMSHRLCNCCQKPESEHKFRQC